MDNDRFEALSARLAAIEDIEAIRTLKARYCRALDLRRLDDLRDTLLPHGAIVAYEGFPQFNDREEFIATFEKLGCAPGVFDIHHGVNPEITLTGADEAVGKWSLHFKSIIEPQSTIITMGVEYDDRYVRRDGRWWIAETRTTRPFCLIEALDGEARPKYVAVGKAPESYA